MIRWLIGEDGPDRTLKTVLVVSSIVIALLATFAVLGCSSPASRPGDPYWKCCDNEGGAPRMRAGADLGDEVWAEWWAPGAWQPWCRIAFDREEWRTWHTGARAKWTQYDLSAGATGLVAR